MELDSFLNRMEAWMSAFRNASMIDSQAVLVPGDPEWLLEDERQLNGVNLLEAVIKDLNNLAMEIGIEPFSG
jgi:LDH2 family malate/lactate/ureidoglycolate dehydrogenase